MSILKGKIIHGEKKGRMLGFPTANIEVAGDLAIETGIYAGYVMLGGKSYGSALYVRGDRIIEAFVFDFEGDLYGQSAEIILGNKIREKRPFKDDKEAIEQISKDVEEIRRCLQE